MTDDEMPADIDPSTMFVLHDAETVRFNLPPLPIEGVAEPLRIHLDFDADTLQLVLERLTVLYARLKRPTH